MQDIFDPRLSLLKKGRFTFPVKKARRFSYTSQKDLAPFVVQELMRKGKVLNRAIEFVEPGVYSIYDVERVLSEAAGRPVRAPARFPAFYLYMAAAPYFRGTDHRYGSILPLIRHFDRCGSLPSGETVGDLEPTFRMTRLKEHLVGLFES